MDARQPAESHNDRKPSAKQHMTTTPESELVRLARAGDVSAFEALYRAYNDRIYNFARSVTGFPEDACDVTQDTFIRAWNSLRSLRDDATFCAWLHRIALNRCRDEMKQHKRRASVSIDDGEEGETVQLEDDGAGPEDLLISGEVGDAVRRAVDSLSEDHRIVVTLHHIEGLDVESVADILSLPRGTVMSRLSRAREALRRKLAPYVEGDYSVRRTK